MNVAILDFRFAICDLRISNLWKFAGHAFPILGNSDFGQSEIGNRKSEMFASAGSYPEMRT